jgi:hypothetical protein
VFDSSRLLNTILDQMLRLLPAEPAVFKQLDDIGEAEPASIEERASAERAEPESGVRTATGIRAAS